MTLTLESIIAAYRVLAAAKLDKMETKDKFAVIRALRQMRPLAKEFDDFVADARERLRPSSGGEAVAAEVAACVSSELSKEVSPEYSRLSDEAFGALLESNPEWGAAAALAVSDVLCE